MPEKDQYTVAIIGSTGRGDYGHGIDTVWLEIPRTTIVAVADDDEEGLSKAKERLSAPRGYDDFRVMLEKEKPDLVAVCPRWLDRHLGLDRQPECNFHEARMTVEMIAAVFEAHRLKRRVSIPLENRENPLASL